MSGHVLALIPFAALAVAVIAWARLQRILNRRLAAAIPAIALGAGTRFSLALDEAFPTPSLVISVFAGVFSFVVILAALQIMHRRLKPDDPRYLRW